MPDYVCHHNPGRETVLLLPINAKYAKYAKSFFTSLCVLRVLFCFQRLFSKMLIELDDCLNTLVEMVEAVVLVWGVDGIFTEAEAH